TGVVGSSFRNVDRPHGDGTEPLDVVDRASRRARPGRRGATSPSVAALLAAGRRQPDVARAGRGGARDAAGGPRGVRAPRSRGERREWVGGVLRATRRRAGARARPARRGSAGAL